MIAPEAAEVRELVRALEKEPRDLSLHRKLGLLRWNRRELTEALIEFRKIHLIEPKNREALFAMAAISLERGHHAKAFEFLFAIAFREDAIGRKGEPFDMTRLVHRSRDFPPPYDKADWEEMFRDLDRRVRTDRAYMESAERQGNLCLQQRCYEKAIRIYARLSILEPRNAAARLSLATALSARRRDGEAEAEFNQAILLEPKNPAGYKGIALIRARRGEDEKARAAFEQVLVLDPDDDDARRWIARTG